MSLVDLGKRLLDASKRGETDEVRTLMSNGAPFTTDWLGTSPLHFSAQFGHLNTAEVLLRAGISRDARTKVDRTPLHVASQEGHADIVTLLLQHAADIDAKDMLKMTPLHWASENGHVEVVDNLLKNGADMSCENKFEKTALDIAITNGRPDIVQTIQMAQHTAVGNMEPSETVTVETTEIVQEDIIAGGDGGMMDGTSMNDNDAANLLLHNVKSEEDSAEEGNSTSVLATLAALAEATAQNNNTNTSTSDAINWLESQGITMISTSDGNIITSAVESGQTITLTEAGKIALNIIKQQALGGDELPDVEEHPGKDEKIITYVTETGEIATDESGLPMTVPISGTYEEEDDDLGEPASKRVKLETDLVEDEDEEQVESTEIDVDALLQKGDTTMEEVEAEDGTELCGDDDDGGDPEKLRRELEEIKRQAEQFKQQLKQKDKDLEEYKKALGEISDKSDSEK